MPCAARVELQELRLEGHQVHDAVVHDTEVGEGLEVLLFCGVRVHAWSMSMSWVCVAGGQRVAVPAPRYGCRNSVCPARDADGRDEATLLFTFRIGRVASSPSSLSSDQGKRLRLSHTKQGRW